RADVLLEHPAMLDDVIVVGPGHAAGTLPVAAPVAPPAAPPGKHWPMNIAVHVPQPVHLTQGVLDVTTHGDLAVHVREDRVDTDGTLVMDRGALTFFGQPFPLTRGSIVLSPQHPGGWMDMTFERHLPDSSVRDVSKASAATIARISLAGPLANPRLT